MITSIKSRTTLQNQKHCPAVTYQCTLVTAQCTQQAANSFCRPQCTKHNGIQPAITHYYLLLCTRNPIIKSDKITAIDADCIAHQPYGHQAFNFDIPTYLYFNVF